MWYLPWSQVQQALLAAGPHVVQPPGERTNKHDFVRIGKRMDRRVWMFFLQM